MSSRVQQHSATSLARWAIERTPNVDVFNGSDSRDFCNSFWGSGESGPNIMFARMRGALKTTEELKNFWHERAIIEHEYASKLAKLAKAPIGGDEIGELRTSLDTLRIETEKQAASHQELANLMVQGLTERTEAFHHKQSNHRRSLQAPLERKFKEKQNRESYVKKSREKYESDCVRIRGYSQQIPYLQGTELTKVQQKLQRTQQTLQGNEKDFAKFTQELLDLLPSWEKEWKDFCDSCQDLEEERIEFMKDVMWAYANDVSVVCVTDDLSCERIRTSLDQLDHERDVVNFVHEYGTGNTIIRPPFFVESDGDEMPELPGPAVVRYAEFQRVTRRPAAPSDADSTHYPQQRSVDQVVVLPAQTNGDINHSPHIHHDPVNAHNGYSSTRTQASPPQSSPPSHPPPPVPEPSVIPNVSTSGSASTSRRPNNRVSQPLPMAPNGASSRVPDRPQTPPPPLPQQSSNRVLFYVKALYDYTATIEEEFDFQTGDVIAVTATPDDGWWSGELLDEARRVEGRNVFPSNFVCLF